MVQFPAQPGEFAVLQNDFGAHATSYSLGTGGSFHMCKAAWERLRALTSIQCQVKNAWR